MSHVAECKTVIKNLDVVELAARRLGGRLNRNDHRMKWYGRFVDDSTDWRTMFGEHEADAIARMSREQRIKVVQDKMSNPDHTISFPGAAYTVGLYGRENGTFALRWDYYSSGGLMPHLGDRNASKFSQAYAIEATKRAAKLRGYTTKEVKGKNGAVQVEVMVR